ncbi:hypothetical protein CBP36_18430 [Acidovorax carolinensis]|uniref:Protein NO VEIN C-terminal domain-containing protein n=1 Tax=Acidovorax carolinensis TaxID=553814 RepID=A0A240UGA1_9BURK|nr:DUF3883 domain-containing protein [Acidovorax carolinensis]ART53875.1 hypothetical protein CBP35_00480 [Acidovorax carolinensis]ART60534.1 hypothetical protein CBP36_18430 [Acidovorax carolinensis]
MRKLALKKLKSSDLSFFKTHFNHTPAPQSKQKGFNLDTRVMQGDGFFPALKALLEPMPKKAVHVDLVFFGPGLAPAHSLARKVKIDAKNLRLNGEFVHDPDDEPDRYSQLIEGDFAVMEFGGDAVPDSVKVVLVTAKNVKDTNLHKVFSKMLPSSDDSMAALSEEALQAAIEEAQPHAQHPIRNWLAPVLLEEIGSGDSEAIARVNKLLPRQGFSPEAFKATKDAASRNGQLGEELLKQYLESSAPHGVTSHEWTSQINAISPYDFSLTMAAGELRHADAKSTSGPFSTRLYLSTAEIRHALGSGVPYDIYRLYNVTEESAEMRVARDVKARLQVVMDSLAKVPAGVNVDSLSFEPDYFAFEPVEIQIVLPMDE